MTAKPSVFNIPSGMPFAHTLAQSLIQQDKNDGHPLSKTLILLPTRRACRNLQTMFLKLSGGAPMLLPRMQSMGDVDEEELTLLMGSASQTDGIESIKPAISSLKRQLILAKLIQHQNPDEISFALSLNLAASLGHLWDQILIEELSMDDLINLVPDHFASHWQITLQFLKIISVHWPRILKEEGAVDAAKRRSDLMDLMSNHWQKNPPAHRIIAAGSTGSLPATARLLKVVANLPNGVVILPGLDADIDNESWNVLSESHPQHGLKSLLHHLNINRNEIQNWHEPSSLRDKQEHETSNQTPSRNQASENLCREIMRPAETTHHWLKLHESKTADEIKNALANIRLIECENAREEADIIAMLFRKIAENPEKTAALVTPDRNLARRVINACARWDIDVDDSAGQNLDKTPAGLFAKLVLNVIKENFSPTSLLALLKHQNCNITKTDHLQSSVLSQLEIALRGVTPAKGLSGLKAKVQKHNIEDSASIAFLDEISLIFEQFMTLKENNRKSNTYDLIDAHLTLLEHLFDPTKTSNASLWSGEDGEALAQFFIQLREEAKLIGTISCDQYYDIFAALSQTITVRRKYGPHPRLMILGQLEARMADADLLVISGLNEGTWPQLSKHDPWMSKSMRRDFGLPDTERMLGLAAHDFVQALCRPDVVITRSLSAGGTPTIPARWLQRLETIAMSIDPDLLSTARKTPYASWLSQLDTAEALSPISRPHAYPPREHRPRKLSVTAIETWLKDPYAIYAKEILKLKPVDPLEKEPSAMEKGIIMHAVFEEFCNLHPNDLPENAKEILSESLNTQLQKITSNSSDLLYWTQRFISVIDWFYQQEKAWRPAVKRISTEARGSYAIPGHDFLLHGRADRIDQLQNSHYAIIDYKSGGQFSAKAIISGHKPQLVLEALILEHEGFTQNSPSSSAEKTITNGANPTTCDSIQYWVSRGGHEPGNVIILDNKKDALNKAIENAQHGLKKLIMAFDNDETPYISIPRNFLKPDYSDYTHFARIQEWSALGDSEETP